MLSLHLPTEDLKKFFENIEDLPEEKILLSDKAFIIDKIRVGEGRSQLYGTQIEGIENGKIKLKKIEDEEGLEKRRKEMKMETLSEYLKKFTQ